MEVKALIDALNGVLFGQERIVKALVATAIAGGHALFEGLPGLGKTLLAESFARASGLSHKRIQFTPDLLPADITGTEVFRNGNFTFEPGPIFAQVVLADEINRAPPKTQAALLEAMQEGMVSTGGTRHPLPQPFMVLATENPIEVEGTYPLPEAQLDRFMAKIEIAAPRREVWLRILSEEPGTPPQVVSPEVFLEARAQAQAVKVPSSALEAMINTAFLSAEDPNLRFGLSPRGVKAWLKLAKAWAYLEGRAHTEWEDLRTSASFALPHRLFLTEEAMFDGVRAEEILERLLERSMPKAR